MRNIIKKILKESEDEWSWANFEPSEEMLYGAIEYGNGWLWSINDFNVWRSLYSNLKSLQLLHPKWCLRPDLDYSKSFFNLYLKNHGNFHVFLPYDRENLYAWFEGLGYAIDKDDEQVKIPV